MAENIVKASFHQERLWVLDKLEPESSFYNLPSIFLLEGKLDIGILEKSLNLIFRRHDSLRTNFIEDEEGCPCQYVRKHENFAINVVDMTSSTQEDVEHYLRGKTKEPFDLSKSPLFRCILILFRKDVHYLFINKHHIISDGTSQKILFQEISESYNAYINNNEPQLPEIQFQYTDFSNKQKEAIELYGEQQLSYWSKKLEEPRTILDFPGDYKRPDIQQFVSGVCKKKLSPALSKKVRDFRKKHNVSLFKTLFAVLDLLVSKLSGQPDFFIGYPSSGRTDKTFSNQIGFFINTLVHRASVKAEDTFLDFLQYVNNDITESLKHQDYPFQNLVEALHVKRDTSRNPLFQIFINSFLLPEDNLALSGINITELTSRLVIPETKFDIELYIRPNDEIGLELIYNTTLFKEDRMEHFLDQFLFLLKQIIANPHLPLDDHTLLSEKTYATIPVPTHPIAQKKLPLVPNTFLQIIQEHPDATAVSQDDEKWSYQKLGTESGLIAKKLLSMGLQKGDVVAVTGDRSLYLIAAMMGVLLSGGILVTLDETLPNDRKSTMLTESKTKILIDFSDNTELCNNLQIQHLSINSANGLSIKKLPNNITLPQIDHDDPAYIFFTSGTTGTPKGVLGCHKGLAHFLTWQRDQFKIGPGDKVAQLTGLSFDVVLRDIFLPLTSGAALCLPAKSDTFNLSQALHWMDRTGVTAFHMVPSLQKILLNNIDGTITLSSIRWLFSAGEPLTHELIDQWYKSFPDFGQIVNLYGPTETTLAKCFYQVPGKDIEPGVQPIGKPLPDTQILILNRRKKQCGIGELGEIAIRTQFRSFGYINNPSEQKEKFITNPYTAIEDDKIYLTGDLGRYRPDGNINIFGRIDHQVKINGVRIELGEIENVIKKYDKIKEVVLMVRQDVPNTKDLVAYIIKKQHREFKTAELISFLKQRLPEFMVPNFYVVMDAFPLNQNGKINRKALPIPKRITNDEQYIAPENETEKTLAGIYSEILNIKKIGLHNDFFQLGGNSLKAIQLVSIIKKEMKVDVSLVSVFQQSTVKGLARVLTGELKVEAKALETIKNGGNKAPVFYVGSTLIARKCAEFWEKDRPLYALNILMGDALFGDGDEFSIKKLAEKYVDEILEVHPDGLIHIFSYCLDQVVAFEICHEIIRRGKNIGGFILVDFPRLGQKHLRDNLNKYSIPVLYNKAIILIKKVIYKFIGDTTVYHTHDALDFYKNVYTPACYQYNADPLHCDVIMFNSLEYRHLVLPDFFVFDKKRVVKCNMPFLHLPMYRTKRGLKSITKKSKSFVSEVEIG